MTNTERRKPRAAAPTSRARKAAPKTVPAPSAPGAEPRPRDPDPTLWTPPRYDQIVDYRESLASDFDAIAADHPRSAVTGGFLLGVAVGLWIAWLARDD